MAYGDSGVVPFHTPGHKQGRGAPEGLRRLMGDRALGADVSDVVEAPHAGDSYTAVLAEAQALAAQCFGAEQTLFSANGTTGGLLALLLAACRPGRPVVVARDAHRSVFSGLVLSGASPVYLSPAWHPEWHIPLGPTPEAVEAAIKRARQGLFGEAVPGPGSGAAAVVLTAPNYYGIAPDLPGIVEVARRADPDLPVLVDEAHGPHFGFHPALPPSALSCGADGVAQSTHKLLGALTQGSMVHRRGRRLPGARLRAALDLVNSTSPSPLVLASLDLARRQLATEGRELLGRAVELADRARRALRPFRRLHCLEEKDVPPPFRLDPTRLVIGLRAPGWTGQEAARWLRRHGRVQVEMAGLDHLVALVTIGDTEATIERLIGALQGLDQAMAGGGVRAEGRGPNRAGPNSSPAPPPSPLSATGSPASRPAGAPTGVPIAAAWGRPLMTPREAYFSPGRSLPLEAAAGRVSRELVAPYPPGVPVICPGETITREAVEYLRWVVASGLEVRGPADPSLSRIEVVDGPWGAGQHPPLQLA